VLLPFSFPFPLSSLSSPGDTSTTKFPLFLLPTILFVQYQRSKKRMKKFERLRHIRYFSHSLRTLPQQYSSADTNRLSLVHFCVQSLDILGCLPHDDDGALVCGKVEEDVYVNRGEIINWIYGLMTVPTTTTSAAAAGCCVGGAGFKGGNYLGPTINHHPYDHSHIAMTYVALCTLMALGDDLSRIDKHAILFTLQGLQKDDGSFVAVSSANTEKTDVANEVAETEDDCDLRFMYAAIAVWYILTSSSSDDKNNTIKDKKNDYINVQSATKYILSCKSYEGSFGLTPGREGHGGSTFCGVASLYLLGVLEDVLSTKEKDDLIYWCVMRQQSLMKNVADTNNNGSNGFVMEGEEQPAGMVGRPNKKEDTCYSYWIGGTLHLLSSSHLIDGWALREYVLTCQSPYGGFGKVVGAMPDLLHSFYSMAWLTLSRDHGCCDDIEGGSGGSDNDDTVYESETRLQVRESIGRLSRLDCALGMCAKRTR
jgi:geranylgeranyl transferase type-1 subunit beta